MTIKEQLMSKTLVCRLLVCAIITIAGYLAAAVYGVPFRHYIAEYLDNKGVSRLGSLDVNDAVDSTDGAESCNETMQWYQVAKTKTSLREWTFQITTKCPQFSLNEYPKPRQKVALDCRGNKPKMIKTWTYSPDDIYSVNFRKHCLRNFINNCCLGDGHIPNVIHYVWYTDTNITFFHFLSFMSVIRFVKPCLVLIHGDYIPKGRYWDYFVSISPNVIHVKRERPTSIYGHTLAYREHSSDIMRIEALKEYGGIYLDYDEVVLRSLEPLRKYEYVQGQAETTKLGSQLIMANPEARFLDLWYDKYRTDYRGTWTWNALEVPKILSTVYPGLIHVEGYNFTRPNYFEAQRKIFQENFDWSINYGMHMFARVFYGSVDIDVIRRLNTTLGSVSRHILFGNKELCDK